MVLDDLATLDPVKRVHYLFDTHTLKERVSPGWHLPPLRPLTLNPRSSLSKNLLLESLPKLPTIWPQLRT